MQPISYMYRKYINRSHISCEHEKKTRYAHKQSRKSCSDRTPENKISALRAYKENDTFYAWKMDRILFPFPGAPIRVAEYPQEILSGNEPVQV